MNILKALLRAVSNGGRLILGFYESGKRRNRIIKKLKESGFRPSGVIENPGGSEFIIWIDNDTNK